MGGRGYNVHSSRSALRSVLLVVLHLLLSSFRRVAFFGRMTCARAVCESSCRIECVPHDTVLIALGAAVHDCGSYSSA